MPRVLMIVDHAFPPDIRVENEALALIEAGYEVTVLAIGPDSRPPTDVHRGITIVRNRISAQRRNKMRGLAGTVPILDRHVVRHANKLYRESAFDAVHVHDLYLFGGGLRAGRELGVPVVGDLHENWVEALKGYAWSTRFPGRLFINFDRWERVERLWTRSVDRLIVVVDEALERNQGNGVDPARMVVVSNTLNVDEFESHPVDESLARSLRGPFHLLYVGGFDLHRGIDTVLDAMPAILNQVRDATLTLVGDGRIADDLKDQSRRLGIEEAVRFEGWQPHGRLKSYMLSADVCLVPHRRTPHTDATLPHKLFQYMYCAKAVVVSDCKPLERIVEEVESGLVFKSGVPASLSRSVLELANRPALRSSMGTRGRDAVLERYNWKVEAKRLVQMYDALLEPDRNPIPSRRP